MNQNTNDSQQTIDNTQHTIPHENTNIPEAIPITSPRNHLPFALTMTEQCVDTEHGQRRVWLQNSLETTTTHSFRDSTSPIHAASFINYLRYFISFP